LQEYFYGDYGKIGMILGEGFFAPFEKRADDLFADFFDYDGQAYQDRIIYSLLNVSKMTDLEFENALRKMLKMK
jgi:5-methylcytosine-specific restriction protein B